MERGLSMECFNFTHVLITCVAVANRLGIPWTGCLYSDVCGD